LWGSTRTGTSLELCLSEKQMHGAGGGVVPPCRPAGGEREAGRCVDPVLSIPPWNNCRHGSRSRAGRMVQWHAIQRWHHAIAGHHPLHAPWSISYAVRTYVRGGSFYVSSRQLPGDTNTDGPPSCALATGRTHAPFGLASLWHVDPSDACTVEYMYG
jgi:hypothetical protein